MYSCKNLYIRYGLHKFKEKIHIIVSEVIAYSEGAVVNNAAVVEYCRISMAALSGGTAGLLGLTGIYGFGFYIFAVFSLWVSTYLSIIHEIQYIFYSLDMEFPMLFFTMNSRINLNLNYEFELSLCSSNRECYF